MTDRCPRGHDLDAANLYVEPNGARRCRACRRAGLRAHHQRHRDTESARKRRYRQRDGDHVRALERARHHHRRRKLPAVGPLWRALTPGRKPPGILRVSAELSAVVGVPVHGAPHPSPDEPWAVITWSDGASLAMSDPHFFKSRELAHAAGSAYHAAGNRPFTVVNVLTTAKDSIPTISEITSRTTPALATPYPEWGATRNARFK